MKIYKVVETKKPLFVQKLENGVTIIAFDGYALGTDGKKYYMVSREIGLDEDDDEIEVLGWSCEVDCNTILDEKTADYESE